MTFKKIERDPIANLNAVLVQWAIALTLLVLSYFVIRAQLAPVVRALETTQVTVLDKSTSKARREKRTIQTTWQKKLSAKGIPLYIQCRLDSECNRGLRVKPVPHAGLVLLFLGLLFVGSGVMTNLLLHRKRDQLDDAKWLSVDEYKHPEVTRYTVGTPEDPVIVPLGYVIEQLPMPNNVAPERPIRYRYTGLKKIGLTSKMLQEHVLVYGPTGTGKTSRVLMHFLMAFARRGDATVVLDFKYPEPKESFMEAISMFRRMGNPVYPVLPYALGGYHIPIFDYIQTHQDGRELAAILVPKTEYGDADSNFYKDTQQIILGSVLKIVASSPTPNFSEVIRVFNQPLAAFTNWLAGNGDLKGKETLLRFLEDSKRDWGSFVTGILNALGAFEDDRVSRTFASVEGRNFDVEAFVTGGGMLYFGVDSDMMRGPHGEVLTRVFDNWLTNRIVRLRKERSRTGPQRSVRLVYDEAPSIGRLRYVLKSVATLRSVDVALIFGIQNEEQMSLVYGENVWKAIDQNLATQIILPTGFKKAAAAELSRNLCEREIRVKTTNQSSGMGGITASNIRKGHGYTIQKRALVTPSEIGEWPYFTGILLTKGTLPPALLAVVPLFDPKPSYYGLDGRQFTLNNQDVYDEWIEIMEDLSDKEREAEIHEIINEFVTDSDRKGANTTTLKDVFNEWIRFAIADGATFRRNGKLYDLRYETLHPSLKGPGAMKAVQAFMASGWIDPGKGIQDSPEDWDWVKLTQAGMNELGRFAQLELANMRFSSPYIQERKRLSEAAPDLGARYEEAREVLPEEAARTATLTMLQMQDATLPAEVLDKAADLIMARFPVVQDSPVRLVAVPLSMPFERIVPKILKAVQGEAQEGEDASWEDDDTSWDERAGLTPRPSQAQERPATAAADQLAQKGKVPEGQKAEGANGQVGKETKEADEKPGGEMQPPQGPATPPNLTLGSQGGATPDIAVEDDEDEDSDLSLTPPAPSVPEAPPPAPAKPKHDPRSNLKQFRKPQVPPPASESSDRQAFDGDL